MLHPIIKMFSITFVLVVLLLGGVQMQQQTQNDSQSQGICANSNARI